MTASAPRTLSDGIATALAAAGTKVKQVDGRTWRFCLENGSLFPARARLDGEWLLLQAALPEEAPQDDAWRLLALNARLDGLCKFASPAAGGPAQLRAEIPLETEASGPLHAPDRVREACAGLAAALGVLEDKHADAKEEAPQEPAEIGSLLDQAGWPFSEKSGGRCAVDLETKHAFAQALVSGSGGGAVHARTEIGAWEGLSGPAREALGRLLLSACSIVRMARAAAMLENGRAGARFEVRIASPTAAEMGHALAALSVAVSRFGREAAAVTDDRIARAYLSARGESHTKESPPTSKGENPWVSRKNQE